ncbi:MAG: hypothetical protein WDM79_08480 [Terricaulis sp.]
MTDLTTTEFAQDEEEKPRAPATDRARFEIRAGAIVLVAFFGVFFGWAALAPLDAAVVANGVIVVAGNRQTVQHRDGGVVSRLNVREGQEVAQNEILIELAAPELVAQERALFFQVIDLHCSKHASAPKPMARAPFSIPRNGPAFLPKTVRSRKKRFSATRRAARPARAARAPGASMTRASPATRTRPASIRRQESLLEDELVGMRSLADRGSCQ